MAVGAALAAAVTLRLLVGDPEGLHLPETPEIWGLRLRPILAACAVGAALGTAGVFLQNLLRNPLAAPELLGLSAGASLAVTVSFYAGYLAGAPAGAGGGVSAGAALLGALATLGVVYALSQRRGMVDPITLVLIGVIVGILCGAATLFVSYLLPLERRFAISRWTVGALSDESSNLAVWSGLGIAAAGAALGAWLGPSMDAASLGDDEARSVGVRLGGLRLTLFAVSGVLIAVAVVLAGPVGFVGLVCPHVVRLLAGPGHRVLCVGSAVAGAALVVGADAAVGLIDLGAGRMPLGVLTALVGGPVFIWLLRREMAGGMGESR